jgi:hypothetical protein
MPLEDPVTGMKSVRRVRLEAVAAPAQTAIDLTAIAVKYRALRFVIFFQGLRVDQSEKGFAHGQIN